VFRSLAGKRSSGESFWSECVLMHSHIKLAVPVNASVGDKSRLGEKSQRLGDKS
jgi:hypothetical protein